MALVATFAADFSSFTDSLSKATVHLQTFERGTKNAARSMSLSLEGFTGQKVAAEAAKMAEAIKQLGGKGETAAGLLKLLPSELASVSATLETAAQKAKLLGEKLPASLQLVRDEISRLPKATDEATSGFGRLGDMLTGAVAGGVAAVATFALNAAKNLARMAVEGLGEVITRGTQVAAISGGFVRLAGGIAEADVVLGRMRVSTRGLITDFDLMSGANKAMLLGLGLNATQMADLAKTATILGRAMGQDATKSLDDLIVALGRSSPLILDNLGLSVKVGEANETYAKALGKSVEALTDAEKKQAFMNAAMAAASVKVKQLGEVQLTLGDHIQRATAFAKNQFDQFSGGIAQSTILSEAFNGISRAITLAFGDSKRDHIRLMIRGIEELAIVVLKVGVGFFEAQRAVSSFLATSLEVLAHVGGPLGKVYADQAKQLRANEAAYDAMKNALVGSVARMEEARGKTAQMTVATNASTAAVRAFEAPARAAAASIKKSAEETEKLLPLTRSLSAVWSLGTWEVFPAAMRDSADAIREALAEMSKLQGMTSSVATQFDVMLKPAMVGFKGNLAGVATEAVKFGATLKASLGNIGNVIIGALQGGGSVLKSVGATLGQSLGTDLVTRFGANITKALGPALGGAFNAVIPGLGALIGPLIEKIGGFFKNLFGGISPEVKAARVEVEKFQADLAKTLTLTQRNEAGGQKWAMTVIAVRDAFLNVGRTAAEAETLVAKLWNTDRPNEARAAIEEINKVLGLVTDEQEGLNAAIERYGFSIEQLGPAMQKQKLTEMAQELIQDFHLLTKSGIDVGLVTGKMSEKINEYLKIALKTGTEVPASMKPMLQSMIDMGTLTDADGNKLTDLTKVPFAETMTQGFNRIVDALEKLALGLSGTLQKIGGEAGRFIDGVQRDINRIPRTIPIRFEGEYNAPNIPSGDPGFASGTMGRYGSLLHNFKPSGESVVVHGREAILTEPQLLGFASQIAAIANGGAVTSAPQSQSVAVASPVQVYVAVDPKSGTIRVLSDAERRQVQTWINTGELTVPKRMVGGR